jgi:hypothetical protein
VTSSELAGEAGGEMIATEMNKRITTLRSARSFIDWQKRADFVRDLDLTRTTITERVGRSRPDLALDLIWRFMALAEPVINRVDDSNGTVGAVFRVACDDLGALAAKAKPDPVVLAEHVFAAVTTYNYGEFDGLILAIFAALGKPGITALKVRLIAAMPKRPDTGHYDSRAAAVRRALQDLADGEGDVDAYIALVAGKDRTHPDLAAEIGRRLLAAGRAKEAVAALEAATNAPRAATWTMTASMVLVWRVPTQSGRASTSTRWSPPARSSTPSSCAGQLLRSVYLSSACARTSRLCPTSRTCWRKSARWSTHSISGISRLRCTSFTNGAHTDKLPTSSLPGTARSTATSTTCSIPRRGGWRAPIRWRQRCFAAQ